MLNQSNPLAIMAIVLLATAIAYEWRYDLRLLLEWLLMRAIYALAFLLRFWWVPALMGAGYAIDRWLVWAWLLVGIARMMGASVVLVCLYLFWVEVGRPFAQKRSRQWTR